MIQDPAARAMGRPGSLRLTRSPDYDWLPGPMLTFATKKLRLPTGANGQKARVLTELQKRFE